MTLFALWLGMLGLADLVRWRSDAPWWRQALAGIAALAAGVVVCGLGGVDATSAVAWSLVLSVLTGV